MLSAENQLLQNSIFSWSFFAVIFLQGVPQKTLQKLNFWDTLYNIIFFQNFIFKIYWSKSLLQCIICDW